MKSMENCQTYPKDEVNRWPWYKTWAKALFFPNLETGRAILTQANISFRQAIVWNGVLGILYYLIVNLHSSLSHIFPISLKTILILIGNICLRIIISLLFSFVITGITHSFARLKSDGSFVGYYILFTAFSVPFDILYSAVMLLQSITGFELFNLVVFILSFYWVFVYSLIPARVYYRFGRWGAFLVSSVIPYGLIFSCYFLFLVLNPDVLHQINP